MPENKQLIRQNFKMIWSKFKFEVGYIKDQLKLNFEQQISKPNKLSFKSDEKGGLESQPAQDSQLGTHGNTEELVLNPVSLIYRVSGPIHHGWSITTLRVHDKHT